MKKEFKKQDFFRTDCLLGSFYYPVTFFNLNLDNKIFKNENEGAFASTTVLFFYR